ncbi:MAG: hypothetical protein KJO85_01570, partial [Gammaproteobacteria bacterium]|nr:hypothetical protein [Gammaproteobacteria bacterium]
YQGMFSRAEQLYKKNIELNPGFAQGIRVLGDFYVFNLGQIDKGIEYHTRSIQADPGSIFGLGIMVMNLVELGDFENAKVYRQKLADINEEFWMLGWADLTIAHGKNNSAGVEEAWNWLRPRVPPGLSFINEFAGLMRLAYGDPREAREILVQSSPGWLERNEWAQLIDRAPDMACVTAWTLAQTGDEELGLALLDQALAFVERMPTYVEHADNWKIEVCYLAVGNTDKAMQIIETQLAHNHLFWWKTYHQLPMYEAVRFEPRYQEIRTEVERRLAEQREKVAQMNLGTGP